MNKKRIGIISFVVVAMLLLSACATSITTLIPSSKTEPPVASTVAQTPQPGPTAALPAAPAQPGLLASYEGTLENIYQQVMPSVVNIRVIQKQEAPSPDFNFGDFPSLPFPFSLPDTPSEPQYSQGLGSGFVWDQEGHIVTNNHVVEGADKVEVTFSDGRTLSATVVGTDAYSDLAVLRVEQSGDALKPVQLGDSNQVRVGQLAIAIGNPFGLEGTMTVGIVSAIGRTLPAGETTQSQATFSIPGVIQTDAPINPGNSGGVLVNAQGEVIGVTSAIESPVRANAGIGFAVPSALVRKVVPGLIKDGHYDHPYLGISGVSLTPDLAKAMKLDENQRGALVQDVTPNGPADKAGIRGSDRKALIDGQEVRVGGDVILSVNGTTINSMDDLIATIFNQTEVGQKVTLSVLRDGKETQVEVTLEARPSPASQNSKQQQATGGVWLGIQAQPITPEIAKAMGLPEDQQGILIMQVESGSPADQAGLRGSYKPAEINGKQALIGGDIITAVDGKEITSVQDLRDQIRQKEAGDEITLTVLRDGEMLEVSVTLAERPAQKP
ncbi:MAG: PDZ domain-containing protein [Anaerolineae bacterium]|nr:PDZ domain-containing protein [Anaerolineae bacterium]